LMDVSLEMSLEVSLAASCAQTGAERARKTNGPPSRLAHFASPTKPQKC
jgi:hypothetical protein